MAKREKNVHVFGGGFQPNIKIKGPIDPKTGKAIRKPPERHFYGVRLDKPDGSTEWVAQRLQKTAALGIQSVINVIAADPTVIEGCTATMVDQGRVQDWEANGETEGD
jgi:hypothetical protein